VAKGNTGLGIEMLYTNYLYPLQIAAVLLLVAIIAAIALTLRAQGQQAHGPEPAGARAAQGDRLRLVKMPVVGRPVRRPKEGGGT
jgi:NADH-quinone oxidoreductase subunit J